MTALRTQRPKRITKKKGTSISLTSIFMLFFAISLMILYSRLFFSNSRPSLPSHDEATRAIQAVRDTFSQRYGPHAETILSKGLVVFGSVHETAQRMVRAVQAGGRPFVLSFSGYSVTVGRGNHFSESFPFEVQRILEGPMREVLGLPLVVRNAAIGGIPSFPYAFCLEHFLGSDPDVISWDYSMNEGGKDASILEAFVRQAMQQLHQRPMIILLDQNPSRTKLLQEYTSQGLVKDAIAVGRSGDIFSDAQVFQTQPLPPGLQDWDQFGAPKSCPGRASWHPKRQEHAMIGWIIAMHFLQALEEAHQFLASGQPIHQETHLPPPPVFPKPMTQLASNAPQVNDLLYGHKVGSTGQYGLNDLSCRTSFLPATDESRVLPSIVVSGMAKTDADMIVERTDAEYQRGWVLDVGKVERDTKRKVENCGGLGYIDMKIALYGIPESGKLRLWLPHEKQRSATGGIIDLDATTWYNSLIICEANEKRGVDACKLVQDLDIVVGGVVATVIQTIQGAGAYLKHSTCVNVVIPPSSKVTVLKDVQTADGNTLSLNEKLKFGVDDESTGLLVDVSVKSKVTLSAGACCLSHVVWETH